MITEPNLLSFVFQNRINGFSAEGLYIKGGKPLHYWVQNPKPQEEDKSQVFKVVDALIKDFKAQWGYTYLKNVTDYTDINTCQLRKLQVLLMQPEKQRCSYSIHENISCCSCEIAEHCK